MPPRPPIPTELFEASLFRGLSEAEVEEICAEGRRVHVERGGFLCSQGAPAASFYAVATGRARLTQVTEDGHQVLVRFLGPGSYCGIIAALEGTEYQASAEAEEDCEFLAWDRDELRRVLERHPRFALNALAVLAAQCQAWQRRYREVTRARVEQRVALALLRLVRQAGRTVPSGVLIDLPLTREDLAEMTGTTLYTVSRVLSRWERRSLVELGRQRVVIVDRHGLVLVAEGAAAEAGDRKDAVPDAGGGEEAAPGTGGGDEAVPDTGGGDEAVPDADGGEDAVPDAGGREEAAPDTGGGEEAAPDTGAVRPEFGSR